MAPHHLEMVYVWVGTSCAGSEKRTPMHLWWKCCVGSGNVENNMEIP